MHRTATGEPLPADTDRPAAGEPLQATDRPRPAAGEPIHVLPAGPWRPVRDHLSAHGHAVVHTTWGEWLPAALTRPHLRRLLGRRDWARCRRITDPAVRYRFVASRLLMKYTAAAALATAPEGLDVSYRLGGRPYLRGFDQLDLSLTHTGDLMALGLSRDGRIGVDAEPADRKMRPDLLQAQMCTPTEAAELARLAEDEQSEQTLRLWTLKEAYTKALGQGMRLRFTEFGFGLHTGRLLAPDGTPAARTEWTFSTHRILDRYLLSTARHDAGLDTAPDTSARTMLDPGFAAVMTHSLPPPHDHPAPAAPGERAPALETRSHPA
ncbi:4'-phosphopantetheinyl transferase superfamily protein [Streptomyces sp. NPDC006465]|uniref:4'-phosphopantetheinyl transferase family protein n=1 Tax=Streptomyces sp. NPDC006465 TaxID=3157174 RepID=UPI0033B3296B